MGAKAPDAKVRDTRGSCKCDICGRKFLNVQALNSHRKFLHKTKTVAPKRVPMKKTSALQAAKTTKKKVSAAPMVKKVSNMLPPKVATKTRVKKSNEVPAIKSRVKESNEVPAIKSRVKESNEAPAIKSQVKESNEATAIKSQVKEPNDVPAIRSQVKESNEVPAIKSQVKEPNEIPAIKSQVKDSNEVPADKKEASSKKIQFKCPKCMKLFNVYFSAYRHIQKHHCVDKNDKPVDPSSPDLIQPIRSELCTLCDKTYTVADNKHTCENIDLQSERYMCLGCQKTFDNLTLFEHHVKILHATELDSLYFPTRAELIAWKTELEIVTKIKYITLTKSKQKSKDMYHCSHQPSIEMNKILMCPSSLTVTEFNTGYHVHYYKEHFGHLCNNTLPNKYKKYTISPYLKDSDTLEYQQFKSVVNDVIEKAAKVDTKALLNLLEKALDMNFILNSEEPEEETPEPNKNMTDDQITEVLSEVKTNPGKRKADSAKKDTKKAKATPENNENSLLNKPVTELLPVKAAVKPFVQSPSFNDSYKHFVDHNFKKLTDSGTPKKKKVVMKTLIGQFKGRKNTSPISPSEVTPIRIKPKPHILSKTPTHSPKTPIPIISPKMQIAYKMKADIKYEVKEQENDCNILILKI